jgi:hypothetical protein
VLSANIGLVKLFQELFSFMLNVVMAELIGDHFSNKRWWNCVNKTYEDTYEFSARGSERKDVKNLLGGNKENYEAWYWAQCKAC